MGIFGNDQSTYQQVKDLHINSDVDENALAYHHTLGLLAGQASPGDHNHNGQNSVRLKLTDLEGFGQGALGYYGSFYDMTDQPLASVTVAQPIAIGVTAEANGVGRASSNRITFSAAGTYSLTFSIQITNYANAIAKAVFWVRKNGVDYPDSATEIDLAARKSTGVPNRQVITINYVASAIAGDYVQIFWAGDSLDLRVESLPAGASPVYPAVPSIILTVVQVGSSGLHVSPDAPSTPSVLWLDTDEESDIPVPTGGTAGQALVKIDSTNYNTTWGDLNSAHNYIINGAFDIWQRGTSFTGLGSGAYGPDRWAGTSPTNMNQSTDTPIGSGFSVIYRRTSGTVTQIQQRVESQDSRFLANKTVTLSWWQKEEGLDSSTQQVIFARPNTTDDFSSLTSFSGTITVGNLSTSWQRFTTTITLPQEVDKGLQILFNTSGINKNIYIWGVQLELGTVATPFRRNSPSIQGELAACQRYYQRMTPNTSSLLYWSVFQAGTSTTTFGSIPLRTTMRSSPTVSFSSPSHFTFTNAGGTGLAATALTAGVTSPNFFRLNGTVASGLVAGNASMLMTTTNSAFIEASAEI